MSTTDMNETRLVRADCVALRNVGGETIHIGGERYFADDDVAGDVR